MNADQRTSSVRSAFASLTGGYVSVAKAADRATTGRAPRAEAARAAVVPPARSGS